MSESEATLKLKEAGLLVDTFSHFGLEGHNYDIAKPASVPGNTRPDSEFFFWCGEEGIPCDAPAARLYLTEKGWIFEVWVFIPGPGPGDFRRLFPSPDEAVNAIVEYYFGDPSEMNPPELAEEMKLPELEKDNLTQT
ncbi:MAG: hypothetical protein KME47_00735 [Nodosilinea sp. WJT8-NPBG4]|nr:hypothetical protein [Nodosilinea sp. WJT8-NPBG4]